MKNLKLKTANILAIIITFCCFIFLFSLLVIEVPTANKDLVNFLAGTMFSTGFGGVIYFLYNFKKTKNEESELFYNDSETCQICEKSKKSEIF